MIGTAETDGGNNTEVGIMRAESDIVRRYSCQSVHHCAWYLPGVMEVSSKTASPYGMLHTGLWYK